MKGIMKRKLLNKLKSIKPVVYLKQPVALVLQPISVDDLESVPENQLMIKPPSQSSKVSFCKPSIGEEDAKDVAVWDDDLDDDKENCGRSPVKALFPVGDLKEQKSHKPEIDISSFWPPDFDSSTLFDPNLLAAFEMALKEYVERCEEERLANQLGNSIGEEQETEEAEKEEHHPLKSRRIEEEENKVDPLLRFKEKCPPGGTDAVILYTKSLRGIRKTYEDCCGVRFLLQSLRIRYQERDMSMHREYREELWEVLGGKTMPPRLFVKGKYIGGAEQALGLNEQGKFRPLFVGIPVDDSLGQPCQSCNGVRFVLCFNCSGSHRILSQDGLWGECLDCNENGLIICRHCCCC